MTILWFILGIALIFGIARYNESNKLFWTLLFAFVMGFAGTKMVLNDHHGDEQSNDGFTKVYPTYGSTTILSTSMYYIASNLSKANKVVTAQQHASQGLTPSLCEINITSSEVSRRTRDQPLLTTLIKPPEICLPKDFSTHHDSG